MIRSLFLVLINIPRIAFGKLFRNRRFNVAWIQRISLRCSLHTFDKSRITIGHNCEFAPFCDFEAHGDGELKIGEGCYFNRYCMISAHESITIGSHCLFGPGVKIFDNNHKHNPETGVSQSLNTAPITIGNNSWIGSDAIILKGSHIGKNCVIGAGCIVKGIIPDGSTVTVKQDIIIR